MRLAWMSVVSPFKYLHVLPFSGFSKALLQWTMIALVIFSLNELFESNLLKDWTEIYLPTTVLIYHWSGFYSFCQWKQYNNNRLNKVYIHTYALILFHNRGWGWGLHTGAYLPNSILWRGRGVVYNIYNRSVCLFIRNSHAWNVLPWKS